MQELTITVDYTAGKAFGAVLSTHGDPDEKPGKYRREVFMLSLMLGRLWIHVDAKARQDGKTRVKHEWTAAYWPGPDPWSFHWRKVNRATGDVWAVVMEHTRA